jgi:RNA polymerase sigma factor (sigma-70 family)
MQASIQSDQELVKNYISGDQSALETLVKRHRRKIYTSIYLLVKEKQIAEDVFQETFIKVINTLRSGHYNEEGKFLPWVIRIAHNLVIDHFRREKRMPTVRDNDEFKIFDTLNLTEENVQDKLVRQQVYNQVRALVEELPDEQKEVLMMRHYADMSFKEIADLTNVSINTALGRMRYALINLRKMIEEKKMNLSIES